MAFISLSILLLLLVPHPAGPWGLLTSETPISCAIAQELGLLNRTIRSARRSHFSETLGIIDFRQQQQQDSAKSQQTPMWAAYLP